MAEIPLKGRTSLSSLNHGQGDLIERVFLNANGSQQ